MSSDDVRRQWDANTEYWLDKVRTGEDVYREFMNKPYYLDMVGDVSGLALLDLACGEGYFSRIFAQSGARVTGIDFSGEMIKAALAEEERLTLRIFTCWRLVALMLSAPSWPSWTSKTTGEPYVRPHGYSERVAGSYAYFYIHASAGGERKMGR